MATLACALALASLPAAVRAAQWTGRVVKVCDGDTIDVLHAGQTVRVRLAEVDAPEKAQAFGQRARQFTAGMVADREVRVVEQSRDRYGRTVAHVYLGARSLNRELVRAGFAWQYLKYSRGGELERLEDEARLARRGLWVEPEPTAPWEWRLLQREGGLHAAAAQPSTPPGPPGPAAVGAPQAARAAAFPGRGATPAGLPAAVTAPHGSPPPAGPPGPPVIGNRRSRLYHLRHCRGYPDVSPRNRQAFADAPAAEAAGYRRAKNCR